MVTRVIIIEDDQTIREGFTYLVNLSDGLKMVNSYASYEEAEPYLVSDFPDVILLDIELPGINGLDAISRIKKKYPAAHIIILTVYENEQNIFKALSLGASGYLTKNTPSSKIIESITEVLQGGGPLSANVAKMVIQSFRKNSQSPLSKRETQILEGIAEGKSRTRIASELFIDKETVKTHIKNIYSKLDVNSKEEALRIARQDKLI
ncbi:MAG TPA: response regulator transcription factor [Saprospiraceae bacterium]|nr:response regulator transcription factor [Saprospiraceae bacterium]HNT20447.1 response regulator transcription factor [Saprospiraceae bacterium]